MKLSGSTIVFGLLILALSVSACSKLTRSDKPAVKTWWLKPYAANTLEAPAAPVLFVALSVTAVPGLDNDRILTLSDNAELNQFSAARWADDLPELVASLIGRTLQASGNFEVSTSRSGVRPEDCNLQLELREFFAQLSQSDHPNGVRILIDGRYQCGAAAAKHLSLDASVPVNDERMEVIVAAFQQAFDRVMKDLLVQIQG